MFKAAQGTIADFDMYGEMPVPENNIERVDNNGFVFRSGAQIVSTLKNPRGALLLGSEAFEIDISPDQKNVSGLDHGRVEFGKSILGALSIVHPKPEILVVGLGNQKSRILGPETSEYLRSLGIRVQLSNTENAASDFDLLATERKQQIGALLLPGHI